MPERDGADVLRGTLDLLILKTLSLDPMHGWAISQRIQELSDGLLEVNQGSLYPALQRLEYRGMVRTTWGRTPENRRAKFYALSRAGRGHLDEQIQRWREYAGVMDRILEAS